jgi:hypothetical protein
MRIVTIVLVSLFLACAGTRGVPLTTAPDAAWGAEVAAALELDVQPVADTVATSGPEAQPDTRATPDVGVVTGPEAGSLVPDASSDMAPDVGGSVGPEVGREAGVEVRVETGSEATPDASVLPDARVTVDTSSWAPLQQCAADQKVSPTYAQECGIVNGVASPATNRFWPGPMAVALGSQCYFGCVVDGGVFSDAGAWTACVVVTRVASYEEGWVCVARASDCALCVLANN